MKYSDILEPSVREDVLLAKHLSNERKNQILTNLNMTIDDRFSGFKHIIIPTPRKNQNHELLETLDYLDPFTVDQNKIINSKAFRRL
jgi:hypothetical protein